MVLLRPTYNIEGDVTDIDLELLAKEGIRGIIFDLDSTLLAPHSGHLTVEVASFLDAVRRSFKVAIVSNNRRPAYIEEVTRLLDMPAIGMAAKPSRRGFISALEILELQAKEVAVVGDRPLTDVLGGQRAGMRTVLVRPLKTMVEPNWITFFRNLERILIRT